MTKQGLKIIEKKEMPIVEQSFKKLRPDLQEIKLVLKTSLDL